MGTNSRNEVIQLLHPHCAVPQDYCATLHGPESAQQQGNVAGPVGLVLTLGSLQLHTHAGSGYKAFNDQQPPQRPKPCSWRCHTAWLHCQLDAASGHLPPSGDTQHPLGSQPPLLMPGWFNTCTAFKAVFKPSQLLVPPQHQNQQCCQ